ncbi:hypothetical protein ACROYT_G022921 [Oculina patagonica]
MATVLFRFHESLVCYLFAGQCREMKFPSSLLFEGERLMNHVIASGGVMNKDICEFQCYMEHNCVSINFEVRPSISGTHNCDLNNSTHKEHEKDLVQAANYVYHGTNNACGKAPCKNNAICQSGFKSKGYRCLCTSGFTGENCEHDIDECTMNTDDCSPDADCSNAVGSFQCTCNPGFTGDGKTCQDIDECTLNTHDCSLDAGCSNDVGSFQCTCNPGFTGDGKTCQALLQCQSPWIAFQGSCYARFTQTNYWVGANTNCKSEGAQLVMIESADENEFIRQNFLHSGGDYWIGLTDAQTEGVWKWSDGSLLTGYVNWESGQPSDTAHYQNCGGIRNTGAKWHDRSCTEWKGFICKK